VIIIRRHNWFGMRSESKLEVNLKTLADPSAVENWISWVGIGIGIGIEIGETQPSRRFHFAAERWKNKTEKIQKYPKQNKANEMKKTFQQREKLIKWWRRSHESQSQPSFKFIYQIPNHLPQRRTTNTLRSQRTTRYFYNFRYKPTLLQICTAMDEPRVTIWFYFYLCLCLIPGTAHWISELGNRCCRVKFICGC